MGSAACEPLVYHQTGAGQGDPRRNRTAQWLGLPAAGDQQRLRIPSTACHPKIPPAGAPRHRTKELPKAKKKKGPSGVPVDRFGPAHRRRRDGVVGVRATDKNVQSISPSLREGDWMLWLPAFLESQPGGDRHRHKSQMEQKKADASQVARTHPEAPACR